MKKTHIVILVFLLSITVFIGMKEYQKIFPDHYRVTFLDTKLGDATLVQTPYGKTILIDTESDSHINELLARHVSFLRKSIDILILSHGDSDHIGGAVSLMNTYPIKHIFFSGAEKNTPQFQELLAQIQKRNIPYKILEAKKDYLLDKEILLDTLYPFEDISYKKDHGNNDSLVFFLSLFGEKILFTGDIEEPTESLLLASGESLKSDILKAPHHGSKSSSSEAFLNEVQPKIAIAEAALKNPFGHPHQEIVERYQKHHVQFLQTGKEGDISFCISRKKPEFERCDKEERSKDAKM